MESGIVRAVAPRSDNPRWQQDFEITRQIFAAAGVALDPPAEDLRELFAKARYELPPAA